MAVSTTAFFRPKQKAKIPVPLKYVTAKKKKNGFETKDLIFRLCI